MSDVTRRMAKRPPMSDAVKAQKMTKDQFRRLRKAHDDISDVQIELLRNRDAGKGEIDWQTLFQLRGELNRWLYYRREGSRFEMSEAQVKATPSKAATLLAWELWHQIPAHYQSNPTQWQEAAAKVLDEELADLLEKAKRREWVFSRIIDDLPSNKDWLDPALELEARNDTSLAAALEPWKPK